MAWRGGYPEKYKYLDDEHQALAAELQALRETAASDGEASTREHLIEIARMFRSHVGKENSLMQTSAYPDRKHHVEYHAALVDTLSYLIEFFDQHSVARYGTDIAQHIENKLAEELFIDRLFAEYLCEAEA